MNPTLKEAHTLSKKLDLHCDKGTGCDEYVLKKEPA